ncbi:hypothetical protein AQ1_00607 [alpha proteobacterium Q-1]|nr:hypothetical protein AQ1_00607 [alpha proteobacterium Q-1]
MPRFKALIPVLFMFAAFGLSSWGGGPAKAGQAAPNQPSTPAMKPDAAATALHQLFADEWQARLQRQPFMASQRGVRAADSEVPDLSEAAQMAALAEDRQFLERLDEIARSDLDAEDRLNADLFAHLLRGRLDRGAYRPWRIPFVSDSGFHTAAVMSVEAIPFQTLAQYEAYLARLSKLAPYFAQGMGNMRQGMADGFTMPRAILPNVAPGFAALAVEKPEDSAFYKPFAQMPGSITAADQKRLRAEAEAILRQDLLPVLGALHRFFVEDYSPAARETLGATALPDGEDYYAMLIRSYTTLDLSAAEIHQIGLDEAARIRAEMQVIIDDLSFEGSFADFLAFLRTDPQFYAQTSQELLNRAAWIAKQIDEKLPAFFKTLPRIPYGVRAVPDAIAPNYTTGRYWGPVDGVRGGLFMVNTYDLGKRPLYNLPALTLHEGVPGHHLQTALARENQDVPEFRKAMYVVAFGEGWGLYSEKLGQEMGIYQTPYEHFGRLTYEIWRAGRLVVDTGLHAMGWSRAQAVAFFQENSALSQHNIETEVDRYISWPGQALGYKLGEMKILDLRARAEKALGDRFDLRLFHDALLGNGSLPLPVLDQQIDAFIAASLAP